MAQYGDGRGGIVVTGSRIETVEDDSGPVTSVSAAMLEQAGSVPVAETLAQNPALLASAFGPRTSGTTGLFDPAGSATLGRSGGAYLNLRGLGEGRTLVLVDGRRHVGSAAGSTGVDVSGIPQLLIERVDVLTDGPAAVYGADAVSGVVNFRLRRDFEGVEATAQAGISARGYAGQRHGGVLIGKSWGAGRGNVTIAYDYRGVDRVSGFSRARTGDPLANYEIVGNPADLSDDPALPDRVPLNDLRYRDSAPDGAVIFGVSACDRGRGLCAPGFTGSGKVYDRGRALPSSGGLAQGGDSTPIAGYQGDLQARSRTQSLTLLSHHGFSDAFGLFVEAGYARSRSVTLAQPSFDFFTYLSPDNPYLQDRFAGIADTAQGALISRDNYDLGVRGERNDRETMRFAGGLEGRISDHARYELSSMFGQTKSKVLLTGYRIGDRYWAAIDAVRDPATGAIVCRSTLDPASNINPDNYDAPASSFTPGANSGCRPLNLLGNNVRDRAALDWVNADILNRARVRQHVVSGSVSGDFGQLFELPGGPAGFAIGAEYRKEKSRFQPGQLLQDGALQDFSRQLPESGSFDVREVFGELSLPVLREVPFAYKLSFGAAIRLSDYTTVGKTTTWKVDATYAPIPDLTLRGTWSEAVRAPNITELFAPRNGGFSFIADPCDPAALSNGTQYRAANCRATLAAAGLSPAQIAAFNPGNDPTATVSLPGFSGGNRDLREEKARTWTAGVALRPRFLPGLTVSFDWYDITLKDAINTPTAEALAQLCVDQPTLDNVYCQNVTRASGTGYIGSYFVQPQNVANFRTAGADFKLSYGFGTAKMGSFAIGIVGGYLDRLEFIPTPGASVNIDRGEAYYPKWNATGDVTWKMNALTVNYGVSWFGKTDRYTREERTGNPDIAAPEYLKYKEKWQHDLYVAYEVDRRFRFTMGVNNLFDQQPSVASANYPVSFVGRYIYAGAKIMM